MKRLNTHIKLSLFAMGLWASAAQAQNCIETSQYPSSTLTINSASPNQVTTCNYAGEFSINNFTAAGTYFFSSTGGNGNYISVTDNSNNPIGAGYSVLGVVIPSVGIYRAHISTGPNCNNESVCRTVSITPGNVCTSTSQYPSSTVNISGAGNTTVTSCNYGGEFSVNNFSVAGIYTITGTGGAGNYFTVKNATGNIIYAMGASPLVVNVPSAGIYRIHVATSGPATCGTDNACHVVVVTAPGPPLCSGTPATPVLAISSPSGCPNTVFTINSSGGTVASGLTYSWITSSSSAGTYAALGAANASSLTTSTTTTTYYKLVTMCGTSASTSSPVSYSVVNPGPCVCNAYPASSAIYTGDEEIIAVTFASLNNVSTCTTTAPGPGSVNKLYSNYAGYVTAPGVCRGQAVPFSGNIATCNGWYGMSLGVYIDYNQNGSFSDPGETAYLQSTAIQGVNTGTIVIPQSAVIGTTRMRVVAVEGSNIATGTYGYGETEDYCITILPPPTIGLSASTGSICPGAGFTLSATGANSYTFAGGPSLVAGSNATLTPIVNTTYTAAGTDGNGCVASGSLGAQATISMLSAPNLTIVPSSASICPGFSSTLTVSGANTYTWNNNSNSTNIVVTPNSTSVYTVSGTGTTVCNGVKTVTVTVNISPTVAVQSGSICAGQVFTISPTGAPQYVYTGGSNTVSPSATTNYSVSGISSQGCVSVNTVVATVSVYALPVVSVVSGTICEGQNYTIPMAGALSYTMFGGTNPVFPTTTTNYTVIGSNSVNCVSTPVIATVTVNQLPNVVINATPAATICNTSTVTLSASGALTYTWNNTTPTASISANPSTNTSYFVVGTDANGCVKGTVITVTVNPLPTLNLASNKVIVCAGSSATLTAFGSNSYSWSPGTATGNTLVVSPSVTTVYTAVTSNTYGCMKTAQLSVKVNTIVMGITSNTAICNGAEAELTVSNLSKLLWSTGSIFDQIIVTPSVTTTYTVGGTDSQNCPHSGSVMVTVNANPVLVSSVSPTVVCKGESAALNASGAATYSWNTVGSGSSHTITPNLTGNLKYVVTGINAEGCSTTMTTTLLVEKCTGINELNKGIPGIMVYPNPNSGLLTVELQNYSVKTIEVFDVTGRMIYTGSSSLDRTVVDLREFANGVYYITISSGDNSERVKVIKQ